MKTILLTAWSLLMLSAAQGQFQRQYFDGEDTSATEAIRIYFDKETGSTWKVGEPQKVLFNRASTVPNALATQLTGTYPASDSAFVELRIGSQTAFGIMALQWVQKLDYEDGLSGGTIEISTDGGNTWQSAFNNPFVYNFYGFKEENVDTLPNGMVGFSGRDTSWADIWLCFDYTWMNQLEDSLRVRFVHTSSDVEEMREGWMIDNIQARTTIVHTVGEQKQAEYARIYPNPSKNTLHIELQKQDGAHIIEELRIYNELGQLMCRHERIPTKFFVRVDNYPP
ncbi:MAG TPA: hypothetical protein VFV37_01840, partial [Luteibaculaceae bacterium]|nr:hypothetical protein [Luteibaculaceae bacterium]